MNIPTKQKHQPNGWCFCLANLFGRTKLLILTRSKLDLANVVLYMRNIHFCLNWLCSGNHFDVRFYIFNVRCIVVSVVRIHIVADFGDIPPLAE